MHAAPWTDVEIDAAHRLDFDDFRARYPGRTRDAWRIKRGRTKRTQAVDVCAVAELSKAGPIWTKPNTGTLDREAKWDALLSWQEANEAAYPKPALEHDVQLPADGPICVCFPSDWHIGNEGTDHKRLRADNRLIAEHPYLWCAVGGDPIDNFVLAKLLSASRGQIAQVKWQWDVFRAEIELLRASNSLLWVGEGNHDAWTRMLAGIDVMGLVLGDIPVINTREGGLVRLTVGKQQYSIYRKHRPTKYTSSFHRTHFLKRMLELGTPWDFDIGVSEHLHVWDQEEVEWRPGTGQDRHLLTCGSYKVYDSYALDWGLYGGGYGVPAVILWPDKRLILSFAHLSKALIVLDALRGRSRVGSEASA